jgi:predicted nucleic acid-binding Zn ribbon protein
MDKSKNIKTIGESLNELIHQLKLDEKITESRIRDEWKQIMGHNIAVLTNDFALKNGKLTIHLKSSVLRNELYMNKRKVISTINEYLGSDIIKDVIFK